jgi:hypothetical protein
MLKKIISGGQTGAYRAALDVALKFNIPHGGWIPKGRITEEGPLPDKYKLLEMSTSSYPVRTEQNVIDSDGTLIISHGSLTGGSAYTRKMAMKHSKPWFHFDMNKTPIFQAALIIINWIRKNEIEILNVTGPRASKDPTIYDEMINTLETAILLMPLRKELTGPTFSKKSKFKGMNDNKSFDTVDAVVEDLIAEFPLEANVDTANLEEDELRVLELTLGKYLRYKLDNLPVAVKEKLKEDCLAKSGDKNLDEVDAAAVILRELWKRLRDTHRIRVVK